jgi:hypothetical protein
MKDDELIIKGYDAAAVKLPAQIPIKVTAAGARGVQRSMASPPFRFS